MASAAENQKQTRENGAQTRTVSRIVVSGALPLREAVLQEVVVAIAGGTTKDVGDGVQARRALVGLFDGGCDLLLRRALINVNARGVSPGLLLVLGAVGDEGPLDFIRVEESGFLAVGLVQLILAGVGFDLQEVYIAAALERSVWPRECRFKHTVEGDIHALCGGHFILQAKDFMIYTGTS